MPNKISFIYFDIAGVQYNFREGITKAAESSGLTYKDFVERVSMYENKVLKGEMHLEELIKVYQNVLNLKISNVDDLLNFWVYNLRPIPQVHKVIKNLAKKYPIGLLTNIQDGLLPKLFNKNLIANIHYSAIIQSFQERHVKPEKEIYLAAQKKANVLPQEILFIDDQVLYVQAARELGWKGIVFEDDKIKEFEQEIKKIL